MDGGGHCTKRVVDKVRARREDGELVAVGEKRSPRLDGHCSTILVTASWVTLDDEVRPRAA